MLESKSLVSGETDLAVVSTVRLSDLARHNRIDADRYHTDFLRLESQLRTLPAVRRLSLLITEPVRTGHTPAVREVREDDECAYFVKTDTLREGLIDFANSDYVPSRVLSNRDYLRHQEVIVTIIGAHYDIVGRAAVYLEHYPKCVVNQNIAVIRPDVRQLNPFYLEVFLNCKYGRQYLWMLSRQTEQVNLNCREVEELLVPLFDSTLQDETASLAKQSIQLLETSKALYSQAEELLLEELGLKDFKPKYELSYTASLSKVFGVHRVDAEYFQPSYENLIGKLTEIAEVKPLKYSLVDIKRGIEVGGEQYQEEGKPFIRVSNLSIHGLIERDQKYIDETLYAKLAGEYEPKAGELLLTKDATPGVVYVVKEPIEGVIAGGILRLSVEETRINKEYLALCINSLIGRLQIERDGGGSVIRHWRPEQIKKLAIPLLPGHTQEKIESLVRQSHKARKKAKQLLEEAKRKVEEAIENTIS